MRRAIACFSAIAFALALGGCALGGGVHRAGPDTWRVIASEPVWLGGAVTAKETVVKSATEACARQGKVPVVVQEKLVDGARRSDIDFTFRCADRAL